MDGKYNKVEGINNVVSGGGNVVSGSGNVVGELLPEFTSARVNDMINKRLSGLFRLCGHD